VGKRNTKRFEKITEGKQMNCNHVVDIEIPKVFKDPFRKECRLFWNGHGAGLNKLMKKALGLRTVIHYKLGAFSPYYSLADRLIHLDRHSIVSYLHELYHMFQHENGLNASELECRQFSLTIYAKCFPILSESMFKAGRVMFIEDSETIEITKGLHLISKYNG
jgi:hypothetical protein